MFILIVILILIIVLYVYFKDVLKLKIDFKSFLRKGFNRKVNEFGLVCFEGKQGTGKTYSAVKMCIDRKLATGAVIITNVSSFCIFSDTVYISDIYELINYVLSLYDNSSFDNPPNIIIFFDEIFTVLTKQSKVDNDILSFLSQLRKRGILFITTAQEWLEIPITFRRYVRFQVNCQAISLFNKAIFINYVNDGEQLKWSNEENDYIAPRISTKVFKGNVSVVESYDTYETIKVTSKKNKK